MNLIHGSKVYGRGRPAAKPRGTMNGLEKRYAQELELLHRAGKIARFDFEPERLRLADGAYYCPDFRVLHLDGTVEFREVKGHWEEAARVRIKVAAEAHPYKFVAVTPRKRSDGGGWNVEEF